MAIKELLSRGVERIYPSPADLEKTLQKRKIRLYLGIEPTGRRLHLGHAIPLRKLQDFADLGHEAILLIGTGTVLVGDPSQRAEARPTISEKEIRENIATWKEQAEKIIDFSKVQVKENGDWLLKLTMKDFFDISSRISSVQLFKREMFQERLKRGDTVWAHETLYPLLQGYDSVALDADLEIGGTDQTFNMLIGRELMRKMRGKEKFVLTTPMIFGTDGKQMSKTSGNCVWLDDPPTEMYGKLMALPDEQTGSYLELATDLSADEIAKAQAQDPLTKKKLLAETVVRMYHGEDYARQARKEFESIFSKGGIPENAPVWKIAGKRIDLLEVLVEKGIAKSKSEARRLLDQGGITFDGNKLDDPKTVLKKGVLKVGKRTFIKIE
ncbi:MAG: tyrosine--tRNA ligase [Patescibacteria group bacterium]